MTAEDRHIPLVGARNFRDFGGYGAGDGARVRRGVLFRSDGLWRLSDEDLATLEPLGIRNICDLRRLKERQDMPTRWLDTVPVNNLHLPLMPENDTATLEKARIQQAMGEGVEGTRRVMMDLYRAMVREAPSLANLRRIFLLVASEEEVPVLIHCSGGKDRTGISCALILALLGVHADDVMADYLRSQELYSDRINLERAASQVLDHRAAGDWSVDAVRPVYNVDPDYLGSALAEIADSHGDVETFARLALALEEADIARIRANLLT